MKRIALAAALLLVSARASAQSERPARDFDDDARRGWTWEIGIGPWGSAASDGAHSTTWTFAGAIDLGVHHVGKISGADGGEKGGGLGLPTFEGLRWCVGLGCGVPLLLLFAPRDTLLGNEIGLDLRAVVAPDGRVAVRPIFRYASGRFRTVTLVGTLVPELGVAWSQRGPASLALAWSVEAFDVLLDRHHLALGVEPLRMGVLVPLDGTRSGAEIGTALTLRWVR